MGPLVHDGGPRREPLPECGLRRSLEPEEGP